MVGKSNEMKKKKGKSIQQNIAREPEVDLQFQKERGRRIWQDKVCRGVGWKRERERGGGIGGRWKVKKNQLLKAFFHESIYFNLRVVY